MTRPVEKCQACGRGLTKKERELREGLLLTGVMAEALVFAGAVERAFREWAQKKPSSDTPSQTPT